MGEARLLNMSDRGGGIEHGRIDDWRLMIVDCSITDALSIDNHRSSID
jgi:hypothetical protein